MQMNRRQLRMLGIIISVSMLTSSGYGLPCVVALFVWVAAQSPAESRSGLGWSVSFAALGTAWLVLIGVFPSPLPAAILVGLTLTSVATIALLSWLGPRPMLADTATRAETAEPVNASVSAAAGELPADRDADCEEERDAARAATRIGELSEFAGMSNGQAEATLGNSPTRFVFPRDPAGASHLTYDFETAGLWEDCLAGATAAGFLANLNRAGLSTISLTDLEAPPGCTSAEVVNRLIVSEKFTGYQAVLICVGLVELLKIGGYEVLDRVGRGGMAIVLRVRHPVTGHRFAMKLLEQTDALDSNAHRRFLREMEAVCGLAHPNIAVARSVGRHGNQLHIVMELVEGSNLAEWVIDHGPLSPGEAIDYVNQAARALAHAHQRGLIHRDVKPGNLMLGPGNRIKLVDMGLARFVDAIEALPRGNESWHTHTGHLIGTIDYMAPEQADELTESDRRSDIYSLGCTLFFLLTGQSHLRGRSQRHRAMSLVSRRGMMDLRAVRDDLPPCLYELVGKMTRLNPEDRYQTMDEVLEAIASCGERLGVTPHRQSGLRVLMIEDSLTQLIVTRQTLQATRHQVEIEAVTTLAEAIQANRRSLFDIVLLDLNLPDSQGVESVHGARRGGITAPIIVMTGADGRSLERDCIAAGADDFLPKQEIEPGMLHRHILLTIGRHGGGVDHGGESWVVGSR